MRVSGVCHGASAGLDMHARIIGTRALGARARSPTTLETKGAGAKEMQPSLLIFSPVRLTGAS